MTGAELAAGLAALGWVVSPIVNNLVTKGISYLGSDIAEGVEDLETILLPEFQLTIRAAQNCSDKDKVDMLANWLDRLKNAYYDAEAIIHELEYERLKNKVKGDKKKLWVRISSHPIIKLPLAKVTSKVAKKTSPRRLLPRLNKLKKIAAEAEKFCKLLGIQSENANAVPAGPPETSELLDHKVFGRDEIRDQIIGFLGASRSTDKQGVSSSTDEQGASSSTDEKGASRSTDKQGASSSTDEQGARSSIGSYSVVAITGIGGDGKTTLAQYIYQDDDVKNYFGTRVWLSLSENKDVRECIRVMIEGVTGQECPNLLSLNSLHNKLIETLSESKSILLVLDDLWYDDKTEQEWDNLLKPFGSTAGRCKIVVTSRKTKFPNALSRRKLITIELSKLAHDDFKSLFRYYAMEGLEVDDSLKNDLCEIGDEIATKMIKSPLAAKVVGNQLQKCPEKSFWRETLKSDILSSIREVLLWRFQRLDAQLQRCFLFESVYPKGTACISGNHMAYFWMALDFIQSSNVGFQYSNTMVATSMMQLVNGKHYMHDLFRDLAENLSIGDCFRVTNFEKEIPSSALYAFIKVNNESWNNNISSICNSRNLRALVLNTGHNPLENLYKLLPMVCTKFKNLRVLELWSRDLKKLPSVIGDLKNLRYLDVWHSSIEELPDSVSKLYHLQFLILPSSIKTLPAKLTNLHYQKTSLLQQRFKDGFYKHYNKKDY
ncbi:Disease resistance protein RGA2 [Rhynchospora pubera]|uniref:Disease resistance protein RGA2 n=1 Tax=Rhynchospora pubera TaxID=906938 RepID=A0AAV8CDX6_9POAL|nr:Disease resistance protein RGA2 [Rhynchospora pubera]